MFYLRFEIPGLPPLPWKRDSVRRAKWHRLISEKVASRLPKEPLRKARLTLTRCSDQQPDFDNLVTGFKVVVDALVKAKVLIDDKYSVIGQSEYIWVEAPRGFGKIEVVIEEL